MSQFFDDLEAQLRAAAHAQTEAPHGAERPRPRRRATRSGARAIPLAVAVAVTVAVVVVALTLHSTPHPRAAATGSHSGPPAVTAATGVHVGPPVIGPPIGPGGQGSVSAPMKATPLGHLSPQQEHDLKYIFAAQATAMKSSACGAPPLPRQTVSDGPPPSTLLSMLGVLRRPATSADTLDIPHTSRPLLPTGAADIYVRYVRRARVKDGVSYYVTPVGRLVSSAAFSARCAARQKAVLRSDLHTIPAGERASTVALQARLLPIFMRGGQAPPGAGICINDFTAAFTGGGSCETASQIAKGVPMYTDGSTLIGVVPDGVASVAFHYRAGQGLPAVTVATDVVGNVYAVSIARVAGGTAGFSPDITWRSASGRVIKTISTS
jgi:hypothetical protein